MASDFSKRELRRLAILGLALPMFVSVVSAQQTTAQVTPGGTPIASVSVAPPNKQLPAASTNDSFVIGPEDVLAVSVWKEAELSRVLPVRSDGKISLPLIGEVQAGGQTPHQLEQVISSKLAGYISEPDVTVIVQEIKSQRFNILGQVSRPGSYLLASSTTVLDAIAMAGGFRDFAKKKSIYVLRQNSDGTLSRLPFNYKDVIEGKHPAQNVLLRPKDTLYVP